MSYILDALRRADAERERGAVPGLHSQPVPATAAAPQPRRTAAPWLAGGLGAVLLVLAAAWWLGRDAAPQPAAPATVATVPAPTPGPMSAPVPAPAAPAPALPPPATAAALPAPLAATPRGSVATPAAPAPRNAAAPSPSPSPSPAPAPAPPLSPPATAPAPMAVQDNDRVTPFEQLPADVRRAMPALAIGGAIYSDNAASRMLIVGGQLLHEGDNAAPGVLLEQIRPHSAVLRWRELRYEVGF